MTAATVPVAFGSEADFQRWVVARAEQAGWLVAHVNRASPRPGKFITPVTRGFPDLVLVRPPQLVFLELKRKGGRVSPEQKRWIRALQACTGVEAYVCGPADVVELVRLLDPAPNGD